jgi:hypothetical protein
MNLAQDLNGEVDPLELFRRYPSIPESDRVSLDSYCFDRGYLPFVDFHQGSASWLFHTIQHLASSRVWRRTVADEFSVPKIRERELQDTWAAQLTEPFKTQVPCVAGCADIVTPTTIYEIKPILIGHGFFQAVGQVLLYQNALVPRPRYAVIVCSRSFVQQLHPFAAQLEIRIEFCDPATPAICHSLSADPMRISTDGDTRSRDDKRAAAVKLLTEPHLGMSDWVNTEIARRANMSEFVVRSARKEIGDSGAPRKAVIRGRTTTMDPRNIGSARRKPKP